MPTVSVKETAPEESSQDGELATPGPLTPLTIYSDHFGHLYHFYHFVTYGSLRRNFC